MGQHRKFTPDIPPPMLALTKPLSIERHMLEQLSINDQKNDLILERLTQGDDKFEAHSKTLSELTSKYQALETKQEEHKRDLSLQHETVKKELSGEIEKVSRRIIPFERWAQRVTGGKLVVTSILMFLGAVSAIVLTAWLTGWFTHFYESKAVIK